MAQEFSGELNDQVMQAILRKIQEQQAMEEARGRGEAISRNLAGGSFEGRRVGEAVRGGQTAKADALVNMAIENATRQREERLLRESRAFTTSEREAGQKFSTGERLGSQDFSAGQAETQRKFQADQDKRQQDYQTLENEKQRAFASGETDKARQYEAEQARIQREFLAAQQLVQQNFQATENQTNREYQLGLQNTQLQAERDIARANAQSDILGAGIGGLTQLGGGLLARGGLGGLFGGGGAPAAANIAGTGQGLISNGPGGLLGNSLFPSAGTGALPGTPYGAAASGGSGLLGTSLGVGAGLLGGGYAGQNLAKLTGNNTREAKTMSGIGAGIGTGVGSLFGPAGAAIGGTLGGAVSGLTTKLYQGIGKATGLNKPVNSAVKAVKKVFCFDGATKIMMADGTERRIDQIKLGDQTAGGEVESVRVSTTMDGTRYKYCGVIVTGSHAVNENGVWIRVADSPLAQPIDEGGRVYSIVTSEHRIYINGMEFADEMETDFNEELSIDESLQFLNFTQQGVN